MNSGYMFIEKYTSKDSGCTATSMTTATTVTCIVVEICFNWACNKHLGHFSHELTHAKCADIAHFVTCFGFNKLAAN